MKLLKPLCRLDLGSFLPAEGEDRVEMVYADDALDVNVYYESESAEGEESKKVIRFVWPSYFVKTPFPGHSLFNCPDDRDNPMLDCLVEYEVSDLLMAINKAGSPSAHKHFRLYLQSEGMAIHVVAQSFEVLG
ncbi:hypothetical protein [Pseudomonas sp. CC120222-01a]|uniref:hypothetical protein n=1 Tax=Pseudomonas sp. CC120222-01a TaxID=1378075 RepID=UPI000D9A9CC9|nr:hypothetical protein [Pseudomonas sp. CC120222-01a]PVZ40276.1 hypothetical protein N430_03063 [Pseudomonas sp. CC120222-01a]